MHSISRKLFMSKVALLAGSCPLPALAKPKSETISLKYIARLYTMRMSISGKKIVMKNKWNTLEFETDARRAWINGVLLFLHYKCHKKSGKWGILEDDFRRGIDPILRSYAHIPTKIPQVVMLDPGHGDHDTGARGQKKTLEKTVVLDISMRVKKHLESKRIKVVLTRTTDTYPTLKQRCDYASRAGADLFVSIHADGAASPSAHGVETFVMTATGYDSSNHYGQPGDKTKQPGNLHDAANAVLGFSIQSNLVNTTKRSDRGLRRARFAVIRNAPCPAALVECGFLTNSQEESLLMTPDYREAAARGISNGIVGYMTLIKHAAK